MTAGLEEIAECIARADVELDWTHPARGSVGNMSRHFGLTACLWAEWYLYRACRDRSCEDLGRALHCVQDAIAHGVLGLKHVRHMAGLARDPDDWDAATLRVRRAIERRSVSMLCRFRPAQ
ncbi:MAG: hypothetical protein ABFC80_10435 [Coriobacteriales bacterium]